MKLFVLILLSVVLSAHSIRTLVNEDELMKMDIDQRTQRFGYYNNLMHDNSNFPDQTAQSTASFNPSQIEQRQQIHNNPFINAQRYPQNFPTNAPQSQLFNVGYSVSFTNNKQPSKPLTKYPRTNTLGDGEIITGIRKQNEEVRGPSLNMPPQDYVTTALISRKKQKISGIKPKTHFLSAYPNPKTLLTQANLSPATQKYYKSLEQLKPQIQNIQELQQKYSWRNLSPGVEIIRSTEVPTVNHKFTSAEQPLQFDHIRALGRTQDFDYTNGIGNNSNIPLFYNHVKKANSPPPPLPFSAQNLAKLPLDTTLLKEPIQIDTRLVEDAMRNEMSYFSNNQYTQPQRQQDDVNYLQQNYRTIPVNENIPSIPDKLFQPEQQLQGFQEYQPSQSRFQYNFYGKSQPVVGAFNEQPNEKPIRQPRFLNNHLSTNLRPPPFATIPYQRRFHML